MRSWLALAAVAAIGIGGVLYWRSASSRYSSADAEAWRATEADLRARLAEAEKRLQALGQAVPEPSPSQTANQPNQGAPSTPYSRREADLAELIRLKDVQLGKSESALADLRAKFAELEQRLGTLQDQDKQLRETEVSLRKSIDANTEQILALQEANRQKDARTAQLEASMKALRSESEQNVRSLQKVRTLSEDLEDLARRREVYITNILARYREATDSLRTLSLNIENRTDGASVGRTDISRIQTAITSADEDMRQLRALSTRSRQLQKELLALK
jgi:chromosome segregation ATPase